MEFVFYCNGTSDVSLIVTVNLEIIKSSTMCEGKDDEAVKHRLKSLSLRHVESPLHLDQMFLIPGSKSLSIKHPLLLLDSFHPLPCALFWMIDDNCLVVVVVCLL